jgi:formate dehydrogenase subunit gamma
MKSTRGSVQGLSLVLVLTLGLLGSVGASAQQQPPQPAPSTAPASSAQQEVQRQQTQPLNNAPVWRDVQSGRPQYTSIPGRETGVLIQPPMDLPGQPPVSAGEAWRKFRNGPITFYGGWLIVLALLALGVFYKIKGPIKLHQRATGRLIERFSSFERIAHWTLAISFSILAITGLIILFGKYVLLPVFGYQLFAWLTQLCKHLHNFVGPVFIFSLIVMIVVFIRDNWPKAYDLQWLRKFGGLISGEHVPSGRFNAGEKGWFWMGAVLLGSIVSVSGLVLDFPNFDQTRAVMIQANLVHVIAAVCFIALSFAHIYLGTVGMEGAYDAMRHGYVDEAWAKEHHELWYDDIRSGKVKTGGASGLPDSPQVQE